MKAPRAARRFPLTRIGAMSILQKILRLWPRNAPYLPRSTWRTGMPRGRLNIVGTGYLVAGQVTQQALTCIQRAEKLFYIFQDPVTSAWIEGLNPTAESLSECYGFDKERLDSYYEMVERMLVPVRQGLEVCGAFYGHP